MSINNLIEQGFNLKAQINNLNEQLKTINKTIAEQTEFNDGVKTGHIEVKDFKVTVSLRENVKWDQEKLQQVKAHLPDFSEYVKVEIKPDMRKLKTGSEETQKAFDWCAKKTQGSPNVKYEYTGGEELPF